ncbi:MAG: protein translocase subunit SecF [Chloroflexi bacterium]|nr:protein translocase subunit SecF [Chloroflexota bacterium]
MIDFVERRFVYLLISLVMLIVAIVALAAFRIQPGLEFSSGTRMTLAFSKPVSEAELRQKLSDLGYTEAVIQDTNLPSYDLTSAGILPADRIAAMDKALKDKFGPSAVFLHTAEQGGNTVGTITLSRSVQQADVEAALRSAGIATTGIQKASSPAFLVRTKTIEQGTGGADASSSARGKFEATLRSSFGDFGEFDFYSVSAAVASGVVQKAVLAVVVASIAILLYVSYAFRRMPRPFRWGTCAVIALVHDVLFVLGTFAILGKVLGVEVDAMFITGALTVVGYSVHDTIVVFDRIRENMGRGISKDFVVTVNSSIMETLGRSLNTSLTTLFVLLALFLIGGVTIRYFILVMLLGIIVGTYSSIFVASQLLVVWERKEWRRFVGWLPFLRPAA